MTIPTQDQGTRDRETAPGRRPLEPRPNRAQLIAAAGAGLALAAIPGMVAADGARIRPMDRTAAPETARDILDMLVTMERFVVANVTANLTGPHQPGLHPLHVPIEQAAAVTALAHVTFWEGQGGRSRTATFTVGAPPALATAVLQRKERITTLLVGAYMAAARAFAELGQPLLVKYAFQAGAVEAEQRALARAVQALEGVPAEALPANKAFETDLFPGVRAAYGAMEGLGLFGKLPVALPYPSRADVLTAAGPTADLVLQKAPNTVRR